MINKYLKQNIHNFFILLKINIKKYYFFIFIGFLSFFFFFKIYFEFIVLFNIFNYFDINNLINNINDNFNTTCYNMSIDDYKFDTDNLKEKIQRRSPKDYNYDYESLKKKIENILENQELDKKIEYLESELQSEKDFINASRFLIAFLLLGTFLAYFQDILDAINKM